MAITRLSDVKPDAIDDAGDPIRTIYALDRGHYAVYRTDFRIGITFSDEPDEARRQRERLAKIQELRGQINGLIDGWRTSKFPGDKSKARRFDRRGADALVMALEGYTKEACNALSALKRDIIEDRTSWARFLYLITSGVLAAAAVFIAFANTRQLDDRNLSIFECNTWPLFFAGAAGAVGAFFSIAIAIHNRTILTDQNLRDNTADALLRIMIGVLSAVALMCLLYSHAVTFTAFAEHEANTCFEYSWSTVLSLAFVAGFSERFVPDLLSRAELKLQGPGAPPAAPVAPPPSGGDEPDKPRGGPASRLARRLGLGGRTRRAASDGDAPAGD
jgi:hypothetical protein